MNTKYAALALVAVAAMGFSTVAQVAGTLGPDGGQGGKPEIQQRDAKAAEPVPAEASQQLKSAAWWRQQAAHYAGDIADAEAKGKAQSDLVYLLARAGDFDATRTSIASITNPQLRIYALCFLAKQYHQKGNDAACQTELQQAGKESLAWDSNFGHSHVIQTYMELGKPEDAIALAAAVSLEFWRNAAFQDIAAKLAGQGKLAMAEEIVTQRLPPGGEQSGWSGMANACADALRINDAQALAARLTNKKLQDRAFMHLVEALVKADRGDEARPFADQISEERLQATALGMIAARPANKQSGQVIQLRIEKAATREEKLALYDKLFAKRVEAGDVAAAEAAIDSMAKTIEAFPRQTETSKFGAFDDAVALAVVQSNYLAVAGLLAKQGDRPASLLRLARARKAVTDLPETSGLAKSMLISKLVNAEIAIGDFSGARASLEQMGKGFSQSMSAGEVAAGLIKSGDVKSGMAVAELITTPLGRGLAMGRVASQLLRAGKTKEAKTFLEKAGDGAEDVEAFRTAGATMAELGREMDLRQWLGELTSNVARAYLCMGAAEVTKR